MYSCHHTVVSCQIWGLRCIGALQGCKVVHAHVLQAQPIAALVCQQLELQKTCGSRDKARLLLLLTC